jgi:hypothetical protein
MQEPAYVGTPDYGTPEFAEWLEIAETKLKRAEQLHDFREVTKHPAFPARERQIAKHIAARLERVLAEYDRAVTNTQRRRCLFAAKRIIVHGWRRLIRAAERAPQYEHAGVSYRTRSTLGPARARSVWKGRGRPRPRSRPGGRR